ncbi:hypothetical protein BE221DRAFT_62631 [Ostreococcus tauri]|uniref:EF-hand domain-containing protein n=1 Tax=Ostreococcus tauri TaxID=70448 RepID=A0A1Y5I6G3_OSTTA|nr:hypothetical protein BE221DRAFT_62631 [Ostreococcus tauri]
MVRGHRKTRASRGAARGETSAAGREDGASASGPSIVREDILRRCFETIDAERAGSIAVEEFLDRLRSDGEMTDDLQSGTEPWATESDLDTVFARLDAAATRKTTVDEFIALFYVARAKDVKEELVKDVRDAKVEASKEVAESRMMEEVAPAAPTAKSEEVRIKPQPVPTVAPAPAVVDTKYLHKVFELIDYDEDGEVTLVEFLSALHSNPEIGALLDEGTAEGDDVSKVVSDVFSKMDADQNKSVSFDEFVEYFTVQQDKNASHTLNKLSPEEKQALIESANKQKVRSMSAFKRGIRFMQDSDLLVLKSYLRDVFKLIDYERNERIVIQEFLSECTINTNISVALDVGTTVSDNPEYTKSMVAMVFKAMAIDKKRVVRFKDFVNYFIRLGSDKFNSHSPLARNSEASKTRSADENNQISALVAELYELKNKTLAPPPKPPVETTIPQPPPLEVVEIPQPPPRQDMDQMDGLVNGNEANADLLREVQLLREEIEALTAENQRHNNINNMLKLKMSALTHMYAVQSAEFQALIDATREV